LEESQVPPAATPKPALTSSQFATAFTHPVRVQAMAILNERIASPREVAEITGVSVKNVAYHFKVLIRLECIELVMTKPAHHGRTKEHFYRAVRQPLIELEDWEQLTDAEKYVTQITIMRLISDDVDLAMKSGTFLDPDDGHLSRTPLTVDRQGWDDTTSILDDVSRRLQGVQEEVAGRIKGNGMWVEVAIIQFRLPDQPPSP
jgi:Bacterial regulatory protein, arsR family